MRRWLLFIALLAAGPAAADTGSGDMPGLKLRGFGTLGAVHSDARGADFVSGFFEPNGAGHTRPWALGVDTKIAVQADATVSERLSAVLQVVSLHRYDNSYSPKIEWAFVKYQPTPELDIRIGRTVAKPFMISDARLVGYANVWVRPPQEVYGLVPITNKDGIDATYRLSLGGFVNSVHASFGGTRLNLPGNGRVTAQNFMHLSDTVEYGPFTGRVAYSSGKVDLRTPSLDAVVDGYTTLGRNLSAFGFRAAAAQAQALADRYQFRDAPIEVLALGASYDRGPWLWLAEAARFNGHSVLADSTAWYVSGAYRVGSLTPYATVARLQAERRSETGVPLAGLPAALATPATTLNTGLNALIAGTRFAQRSMGVGLRWDFASDLALKVQYDRLRLESDSSGRLGNVQPDMQRGGTVHVFSIALDFVF